MYYYGFLKKVTNRFWELHEEKENRIKKIVNKELNKKFYTINKYNFMLNKHYLAEEEEKFKERERKLEEKKRNQTWNQ